MRDLIGLALVLSVIGYAAYIVWRDNKTGAHELKHETPHED